MKNSINLGKLTDIALGNSKGYRYFSLTKDDIFVIRKGHRSVVSYANSCPHKGYESTSMAWKKDSYLDGEKRFIRCASHGALFRIDDGVCVQGPCAGARLTAQHCWLNSQDDMIWQPQPLSEA